MEPEKMSRRGFLKTFFGGLGALAFGSKLSAQNVFTGFNTEQLNTIRLIEVIMSLEVLRVLGKLPDDKEFNFVIEGEYVGGSFFNSVLSINGKEVLQERKKYYSRSNLIYIIDYSELFLNNERIARLKYDVSRLYIPFSFNLESENPSLRLYFNQNRLDVKRKPELINLSFGDIATSARLNQFEIKGDSRSLPARYYAGKAYRLDL